jgi:hypothetical protein
MYSQSLRHGKVESCEFPNVYILFTYLMIKKEILKMEQKLTSVYNLREKRMVRDVEKE